MPRPLRSRASFFLCAFLLALSPARADDFDRVAERAREEILSGESRDFEITLSGGIVSDDPVARRRGNYEKQAEQALETLKPDGTWSDIDYANRTNTVRIPLNHLSRLLTLCRAYRQPGKFRNSPELKEKIIAAYDAWISKNPRSANWWFNDIAVPRRLGQILILIRPELDEKRIQAGVKIVAQSYAPRTKKTGTNTGANRVDRAVATFCRAVITEDRQCLREAVESVGDTLEFGKNEGIMPDGSFLQHGPQLYIQGYGSIFTESVLTVGSYVAGTEYAFSDEKIRLLVDHMLDGVQWFIRGDTIDYTAAGRGLTRENTDAMAKQYAGQIKRLLRMSGNYRDKELRQFLARIEYAIKHRNTDPALEFSGNKNFPFADIMTHRRPEYYVGVKTSSVRTVEPETGNNEGLKNYHLGDGVTLIMRTGNEYDNLMPVWDWAKLPGTTIEQDNHSLRPPRAFGNCGSGKFAGGVSDGLYGSCAFDYKKLRVSAKKSWFFFDDEFVALSTAINAPDAKADITTSLNQTRLNGAVTRKAKTVKQLDAETTDAPDALEWVHHDDVGYFFPTPINNATLKTITRRGNRHDINRSTRGDVACGVFSLYLNHGAAPENAGFAYVVNPKISLAAMDEYARKLAETITVLANNDTVQAVRHRKLGITQIVFRQPAALAIGQISVETDTPACVMLKTTGKFIDVYASDPNQTNQGIITLKIGNIAGKSIASDKTVKAETTPDGVSLNIDISNAFGKTHHARLEINR